MKKFIITLIKPYYIFLVTFLLVIPANISAFESENRLTPYAKIDFDQIIESSGLVKSRKYPGVYWTHNDSGNSARIFAITKIGKIIKPKWFKGKYKGIEIIKATNIDWEDIATDGEDNLVIGDFGNNWSARQDLRLYVIKEPNPYETLKAGILKKINFKYPDQTEYPSKKRVFDAEALFVKNGRYYILTKHRGNKKTKLYVLDTIDYSRVNELKLIGAFNVGGAVTGANLSDDGRRLAVLTYNSVWLFETDKDTDDYFKGRIYRFKFKPQKQFESISFNQDELIISNEDSELYRLSLKQFKEVKLEQNGLIPPSVEHKGLIR
ncbi:MAG TPA: hypothetical protein ENI07_15530 [Desulfobacterales bacterium]|nr:hypothetical protein [Desulfobacterales bacterium]